LTLEVELARTQYWNENMFRAPQFAQIFARRFSLLRMMMITSK